MKYHAGELSREKMITSHVKNCYGYIINRAFRRKKKLH